MSGVLNAIRAKGQSFKDITSQKFVVAGAGMAGVGVASTLVRAMMARGISEQQALKNFYLVDVNGLITTNRNNLTPEQVRYAKVRDDLKEGLSLLETVQAVKPDILLGISGQGGLFTPEIISEMYKHQKRPIIFPLSNPTSKSECTAEQAFQLTQGNCIFASGSPFSNVQLANGKTCVTNQGNQCIYE